MLRHALRGRKVFGNEITSGLQAHATRIVELLPRVFTACHQGGYQEAGNRAIGDALAGIAGHQPDMAVVRVPANKARKVHRLKHLTGPFMGDVSGWFKARAGPRLQALKTYLRIVRLARLMIFSADDEKVRAIALLQTDIMV